MVERRINGCLGCQATTYKPVRDPLRPTPLPDRPWQRVDMEGAIARWRISSGDHRRILSIPRSGICAQAVIPHLDRIFSTHGFPEMAKTDGGPPFNGHDYHQYMQWAGIHSVVVSPEDPEANGLAENFMKTVNKVWHIAHIEGKNHQQELYKFLRHYRATPHSSTGKAPAEVLFNRPFQVRLPQKNEPAQDPVLSQRNLEAKAKQKTYKDAKANTKPHNIKVGDQVLLLQKQSKTNPRYDPKPYKVTNIQRTQITAAQGAKIRKLDAQRFKVITNPVHRGCGEARYPLDLHKEDTSTFDWTQTTETNPQTT